jgi:hypothetical protein
MADLVVPRRRALVTLAAVATVLTYRPARAFTFEPIVHAHMSADSGSRANTYLVETEQGRPALTDTAKRELEARIGALLPSDRLSRFISLGADAVAAELAAGG